jgi:hypothetical protein
MKSSKRLLRPPSSFVLEMEMGYWMKLSHEATSLKSFLPSMISRSISLHLLWPDSLQTGHRMFGLKDTTITEFE